MNIIQPATLPDAPAELDRPAHELLAAAQMIRERGVAYQTYEDARGRVCVLGALAYVQGDGGSEAQSGASGSKAGARLRASLGGRAISSWNDDIAGRYWTQARRKRVIADGLERAAYGL